MINLTCMLFVVGTLVLKCSFRVLSSAADRMRLTQFLHRWLSAVVLLAAALISRWLLDLDAQAGHISALAWLIDMAVLFGVTTMIWSLALLIIGTGQRTPQI